GRDRNAPVLALHREGESSRAVRLRRSRGAHAPRLHRRAAPAGGARGRRRGYRRGQTPAALGSRCDGGLVDGIAGEVVELRAEEVARGARRGARGRKLLAAEADGELAGGL